MFKYTFFNSKNSPNTHEEIEGFLRSTTKPILYTYGLGYRHPTTYKVPVDLDRALEIVKTQSLLDVDEYEDYVHLNAYSDNDMW